MKFSRRWRYPRPLATSKSFPHTCIFFVSSRNDTKKGTKPVSNHLPFPKLFRLYKILLVPSIYWPSVDKRDGLSDRYHTSNVINWKFGKKYVFHDTFNNSYDTRPTVHMERYQTNEHLLNKNVMSKYMYNRLT